MEALSSIGMLLAKAEYKMVNYNISNGVSLFNFAVLRTLFLLLKIDVVFFSSINSARYHFLLMYGIYKHSVWLHVDDNCT